MRTVGTNLLAMRHLYRADDRASCRADNSTAACVHERLPSAETSCERVMNDHRLISVCVCTYKRPDGLDQLLRALVNQKKLAYPFEIIVVDNDAATSARDVVKRFQDHTRDPPVQYFVEPQQNIALARNRSVAEASGQWLAFIDDDESPEPGWLKEMMATLLRYHADGVFGPVIPLLPDESPPWITRGRFFERRRRRTGEAVATGRTSNALIRASALEEREQPFDPRRGLTGGEDYLLFSSMLAGGSYFVWCDQAVVYERVPSSRTNLRWLLLRTFRGGQGYADEKMRAGGKRVYVKLIMHGLGEVGLSMLMAPLMLPFGVHRSVWWLRKGANGLGFLSAFYDYRYEEYRA